MNKDIKGLLAEHVDENRIRINELMKNHTSFRVGGAADFFLDLENEEEAAAIVRLLLMEDIPFYVIGNGSNLLVSDDGYKGVILSMSKSMSRIDIDGHEIKAQAGCLLSMVAACALKNSLTGFEFAAGIPGSVGGAMVMNAGAYGGEMKDIVKEVTVLDMKSGEIINIAGRDMDFSYRSSIVKKKPYLVLSATFSLVEGDQEVIIAKMNELAAKRREKQPLEYPSAGSTFKRPEGYFAGKLIEDSGLKGCQIGGAQVSEKHCGFIINKCNASAMDIMMLIKRVQHKVLEDFGVHLEPEVCMLGAFD